jgi:hypothetical protein
MKRLTVATAALLALPIVATAGGGYTSGVVNVGQDPWLKEAIQDPCMNGDVSSSGVFRSQIAEDKAIARMSMAGAGGYRLLPSE